MKLRHLSFFIFISQFLLAQNGTFVPKEDAAIKNDSVQILDEVEVRSFRRETNTTEKIDLEKLLQMPNTTGSFESLLPAIAIGVSSTNNLSSQYSVRGGNYDENSVYVNGIEVYRPLLIRAGQQEGLSFINPDLTESVSFSAGGFDAQFGDKMASVLAIEYKKPQQFEGSVSVSLLGASAYIGHASKNKAFTQIHGVRYKTSAYFLGTLDTKGEYSPSFIDYQTYLTYQFAPKWGISFLGNISQNSFQFRPKDRETAFGTMDNPMKFKIYFDGQEKDLFRTFFGSASLSFQPQKNLSLELLISAFNTDEEETYDISGEYWLNKISGDTKDVIGAGRYHEHARNKLNARVLNISHRGNYTVKNNELKWGIGVQNEYISDKINEWESRDSAGYSMPHNYQDSLVRVYYNLHANNPPVRSYRATAFVQDSYKWTSNAGSLIVSGGVRANYWTFNNEILISPRASIAFLPIWKEKQNFGFRFATGVYSQSPFYKEMRDTITDSSGNTSVFLNKNIKAQRSLHLVLGADYYFRVFKRPFKLTAEAYYKPSDRVIPYNVDNVRIMYFGVNNAVAYTTGFDIKLFGEFVPGVDSWISFSFMDSKEKIVGEKEWKPRPTEQRYIFSMYFQDYFPRFPQYKVHLKFVWADGLPFGPPRSKENKADYRMPPYRRVDLGFSRTFEAKHDKFMRKNSARYVKSFTIGIDVFNLLGISNVNSYYWVSDVYGHQFAVPNYLTGREINGKILVNF